MTERVREQTVDDRLEPCPYLEGQVARMPLRWQFQDLTPTEVDASLAAGDRRVGRMLYRTRCPACSACQPLRIPVAEFVPSRSQRRVLRRNRDLRVELSAATYSDEKLALYNRHKVERGLSKERDPMSRRGYEGWFLRSCVQTREMRYYLGDRLIGVGILDLGARDASSVYFYFDPDASHRSLGTLSVLVEVEWLRQAGGRYHYLGLHVADCRHLNYKARFFPHERLIEGRWVRFPARGAPAVPAPGEADPTG